MNLEKKKQKREIGEDATKYGEFVCSNYHWLPIEKQKEQADEMENMTKEENKQNIKKNRDK